MNDKYVMISNQRLAGYLMMNGFVLINSRPDKYGSGKNIFFFNRSEQIEKYIRSYENKI